MVQTGHLFAPMPEVIRDDMAFIDRLHFYLPGWEIPKMRNDLFTDHYGFVVDYLAEALRELRRHNFTEISDRHFTMGSHLVTRDRKAVKKTVSGLMKIIHPNGEATQEEIAELLEFAMEGRRRVKEQLKKMGSFEYYHTSFSYTLNDTGEERFVGVPEQGGRNMISADPPPRKHLHRERCSGRHGRHVPRRSFCFGRLWQTPDGGWGKWSHQGVYQSSVQLHAGQKGRPFDCAGIGRVRSPC
jgi:ATP-dependent Lon protease